MVEWERSGGSGRVMTNAPVPAPDDDPGARGPEGWSRTSLQHVPRGPWEFDDEVTQVFDDMLERSIPEYDTMRGLVFELGKRFVQPGTAVVDLGCSRGEALAPFVHTYGDECSYVGVEVSPPMLDVCHQRFAPELDRGVLSLLDLDLRTGYPPADASLTLSVLTLQFVPIEYRARVVHDVYEHTVPGGALVLVEKVLGNSNATDRLMTDLYHGSEARPRLRRRGDRTQAAQPGGRPGPGRGRLERGPAAPGRVRRRRVLLAVPQLRGLGGGQARRQPAVANGS